MRCGRAPRRAATPAYGRRGGRPRHRAPAPGHRSPGSRRGPSRGLPWRDATASSGPRAVMPHCNADRVAVDDLLTERLLRVVDEGRRTATYKLALLLGLMDGAALAPGQSEIPTRALAERVVELYYP